MSRMVENNEPDRIKYKFFLDRSETKCMVHETYTNSETVLAHITGIASKTILPKIFNSAKLIQMSNARSILTILYYQIRKTITLIIFNFFNVFFCTTKLCQNQFTHLQSRLASSNKCSNYLL